MTAHHLDARWAVYASSSPSDLDPLWLRAAMVAAMLARRDARSGMRNYLNSSIVIGLPAAMVLIVDLNT